MKNVRVMSYQFSPSGIQVKWEYLIAAAPYKLRRKYTASKPA